MKLLEFPHSHYCEKAKWALSHKGLDSEIVPILPGLHIRTVKKYAEGTSVPVLLTAQQNIQGSSEIIDFLDEKYPQNSLTPTDSQLHSQCIALEKKMSTKLGEHLRCILYAYLLKYPSFIAYCFSQPMPWHKRTFVRVLSPLLCKKIYDKFVTSPQKAEDARIEFDNAMNELKQILKNSNYLIGNQFSRADITMASMLSLLVMPKEHPFP